MLDPVLFGALVIIAGPTTAVMYVCIAFVAAITLALTAEAVELDRRLPPVGSLMATTPGDDQCESSCNAEARNKWAGLRAEIAPAARGAATLLRGMAPILLAGIALSIAIETVVPPDVTERLTATHPAFSVPIAAALGTPLYISTAVFIPIAEALQTAGVGIGAIVALTIAGAGANLPEFVILSKLARPRYITVLFGYVFGVAIVGGFLTNAIVG